MLARLLCNLKRLKDKLLESLGGRTFKIRKTMMKLKKDPLRAWESKMKTYRQKIEHYKNKQKSLVIKKHFSKPTNKNNCHISQRLAAYDGLHVFRDPKDFLKRTNLLAHLYAMPRLNCPKTNLRYYLSNQSLVLWAT